MLPRTTANQSAPLSAADALEQYPELQLAHYHLTDDPCRLRMHHRYDWRLRLVMSLFFGGMWLLAVLYAIDSRDLGGKAVGVGAITLLALLGVHAQHEITINLTPLTITRSIRSLFPFPFRAQTWKVHEGMEIKAFVRRDSDDGDWHELALVDGRRRLLLTDSRKLAASTKREVAEVGNAFSRLLGVPFTGYARKWRFYWP